MVSEKSIASILVILLGKTAPADKPRDPEPPRPEIAAPAASVKRTGSRQEYTTDFGNRKGPSVLARERELRGVAARRPARRSMSAERARRNALLNEHYRQLEASKPKND